jgi:N-acetylglutamate synthase-like GNAT family acetyltransferase
MEVEILAADAAPGPDLDAFLQAAWGSDALVAHGERIVPSRLPGLVAVSAGRVVGHLSYRMTDDACELTSIVADPPRTGIGSRLMDEVMAEARRAGCRNI